MRTEEGHQGAVLWLTGLPSSGKTTLANEVNHMLLKRGVRSIILDGDHLRLGINRDLGFSPADRKENVRRIAEIAKLMTRAGLIVMVAAVSPYRSDRQQARSLFKPGEYVEIYVKCALAICQQRDPKGLYKKARDGVIPQFTGISAPYEPPTSPEMTIETDHLTVQQAAHNVIDYMVQHGILSARS